MDDFRLVVQSLFDTAFSFLDLESPFFGLTFWQLLSGYFVCVLGIYFFRKFFHSEEKL